MRLSEGVKKGVEDVQNNCDASAENHQQIVEGRRTRFNHANIPANEEITDDSDNDRFHGSTRLRKLSWRVGTSPTCASFRAGEFFESSILREDAL